VNKDEIRALLQKARRYVQSAELLLQHGDYDSAASRLYYAMFYCAEAVLLTEGYTYSRHSGVISGFGQHFIKTGKLPVQLHTWLREAFDKRQIGDYESFPALSKHDVESLLQKAHDFIDEIDKFLKQAGWLS